MVNGEIYLSLQSDDSLNKVLFADGAMGPTAYHQKSADCMHRRRDMLHSYTGYCLVFIWGSTGWNTKTAECIMFMIGRMARYGQL